MSGALNYSVVLDVAKAKSITDFDDLLFYINEAESLISDNRESARARKK